jgi:transcriptional regulator with XRE-family HTH domain
MQRFPEKLRTLRERQNMSLRDVGDSLGVGRTFIYKMEVGERKPNVEMLIKVADFFGVTTDQLARDELEV